MGVNSIPSFQPANTGYPSDKPGQHQAPQHTPQQPSTNREAISYATSGTEAVSFDNKKVPEGSGGQGGVKGGLTKAGEKLWMIPGLSNVLKGAGKEEGGGVQGALGGVTQTWKNNAEGIVNDIKEGHLPLSPTQLMVSSYKGNIENSEDAPERAKAFVAKL